MLILTVYKYIYQNAIIVTNIFLPYQVPLLQPHTQYQLNKFFEEMKTSSSLTTSLIIPGFISFVSSRKMTKFINMLFFHDVET